ncbi:MAG: hypothetical protein ACK5UE_13680 [Chitinophagales bacterium]|jgi:hypothetical protein|nr:hypothetical protein [Sphingobacteriales bacterium]
MDTLTINIKSKLAYEKIKELEDMNLIHIAYASNSYVLNGEPLAIVEFNQWLSQSEQSSKLSINEFKQRWLGKKKEIFE